MRKHQIPPNFDTSKLMLFGLIRVSALLESLISSGLFYGLFTGIANELESSLPVKIIISAMTLIFFILIFMLSSQEPLFLKIHKWIGFRRNRKVLTMRRIRPRIRLKDDSEEEIFDEDYQVVTYPNIEKVQKKKKRKEKFIFNDSALRSTGPNYTQEIIDIESIEPDTGIISLKNGRFVKIYEVRASNFFALSENEQEAILLEYGRFLKVGPEYLQIKIISDYADLGKYAEGLRSEDSNSNQSLEDLQTSVEEHLNNSTKNTVLDHRYYLIFSVTSGKKDGDERYEEAFYQFKVYDEIIRNRIGKRGVRVLFLNEQEIGIKEQNPYYGRFLYKFYNRKSSKTESFNDRIDRVHRDLKLYRELTEEKPAQLSHVFAPRGLDMSHKDYIIMDGLYYSYFILTKFPQKGIMTGFLARFINVGAGFDFDLLIEHVPKYEIQKKLSRRNIVTKANADQMQRYSLKAFETYRIIQSTEGMIQALEEDNEFYYMCPIITFCAETLEELERKKVWMRHHLESYSLGITEPFYEMEDAFHITEPLARNCPQFFEKYRRNILTDGLTGLYPFITASTNETGGILLGTDINNHSPVILDFFEPLTNVFLFGMTGYGKSFLSMLIATRLRIKGIQVYVLSPLKGHEYHRITKAVGGSFIEIGPGSKDCINILEVRPVLGFEENDDYSHEISYLNEKIQRILKFFSLITEDTLNRHQKDRLSPFLMQFYGKFGITDDNSSIYQKEEPAKLVKMPVIGDLKTALEESDDPDLRELAIPLEKFTLGNLSYLNNDTNVDLDNKFCCIDIGRALDYPETRNLVLFIVTDYLWTQIRSSRSCRKAIFFEELWKMLLNRETAEIVQEVFKTIRGYYGVAIANTQNLSDLDSFNVGDAILNNTLMQCFLHCSPNEAEKLQERFKLSKLEYADITGADKGECLVVSPNRRHYLKVQATATESELFETDGNKLKRKEVSE